MTKLHKCLLIDAHYRRCYQSKGLMGERETITTMDCSRKSNTNNKNQARQKSSSGLATLSLLAVGWMLCDPTIRPLEASPEPSGPQPYRSQSPPPSAPRQHQQRYHNPPPPPSIKKQRPPPGQSSEAPPHARPYPQAQMELLQQLDQLKERDTCGSVSFLDDSYGFDLTLNSSWARQIDTKIANSQPTGRSTRAKCTATTCASTKS